MRPKFLVVSLILAVTALILVAGCRSSDTGKEITLEQSQTIAVNFLVNSPMFRFDGKPDSVKLIASSESPKDGNNQALRQFTFTYGFTCLNAGYGDRSRQYVAEVETPHTVQIVVFDGNVISAIVDEKWDMLTETMFCTQEESLQIAKQFVRNEATFVFDGISDSLRLIDTITLRCPSCWQFVFRFESRQAGYGDRTGQMLAQVITPHEAVVTVEQGEVKSAVIDEKWDMINQQLLLE
jgi:hypothetical protein